MEYSNNLTLADTGIPAGATIDTVASTVKNIAGGIRNKAKAKEAQRISDAGNYFTLRPFLKSLIPIPQYVLNQVSGQGITEEAVIQLPEQGTGANASSIIAALKALSGTPQGAGIPLKNVNAAGTDGGVDIKKYIPYIIGVLLLGILVYIIIKRK